jgi:hypothetical protein
VEKVRYLNKTINDNERELFSRYWKEQINHFGVETTYYTHGYSLTSHNFLYGEDPTSVFLSSGPVVMLTDITNDAIMLSKFGIMADCDMTAVVHISSYYETFGQGMEPKSGDLIELKEYGGFGDRPGGRGAPIYEITERDDQNLQFNANGLMGHYIWVIKCKRWEYSSEPGVLAEPLNTQINDSEEYGRMEGSLNPDESVMPYPDSVDGTQKCIFDHDATDISKDYGYYGGFDGTPLFDTSPSAQLNPDMIKVNSTEFNQLLQFIKQLQTDYPVIQGSNLNANIAAFLNANAPNLMVRTLSSSSPGNIDSFVISTSGRPEDVILYTSDEDKVTLDNIAGTGLLGEPTDRPLDGGTF